MDCLPESVAASGIGERAPPFQNLDEELGMIVRSLFVRLGLLGCLLRKTLCFYIYTMAKIIAIEWGGGIGIEG